LPEKKIDFRLVFVLVIVMAVSGIFLTGIYEITIPYIRTHEREAREQAIFSVIYDAVDYEVIENNNREFYAGKDENQNIVGYAMEGQGAGFQDRISIMVGVDPEGKRIKGIEILNMAETPGLGARIDEDEFKDQFMNKTADDAFTAGDDIDVISGATLSSQTTADIALDVLLELQQLKREVGEDAVYE